MRINSNIGSADFKFITDLERNNFYIVSKYLFCVFITMIAF